MLDCLPLRLLPGADLRAALEQAVADRGEEAAFVVAGIGSLAAANLRLAGSATFHRLEGALELLTLSGTLGKGGVHLHASVADATGRVWGGHVGPGCTVRTTAEVLLAQLPGWVFERAADAATGFRELLPRRLVDPPA